MELPKVEIDKETEKWKNALILCVIGASPTIASLERFIASEWSFTAKHEIHYHNDGYFCPQMHLFQ